MCIRDSIITPQNNSLLQIQNNQLDAINRLNTQNLRNTYLLQPQSSSSVSLNTPNILTANSQQNSSLKSISFPGPISSETIQNISSNNSNPTNQITQSNLQTISQQSPSQSPVLNGQTTSQTFNYNTSNKINKKSKYKLIQLLILLQEDIV